MAEGPGQGPGDQGVLGGGDGAQVEHDPAALGPGHYRRVGGSEAGQDGGGAGRGGVDLDQDALQALAGEAATTGDAGPGPQGRGRADGRGHGGRPRLEVGWGQQQGLPDRQLVTAAGQVVGQGRLQGGQGQLFGPG